MVRTGTFGLRVNRFELLKRMVRPGRFEHPTPCFVAPQMTPTMISASCILASIYAGLMHVGNSERNSR